MSFPFSPSTEELAAGELWIEKDADGVGLVETNVLDEALGEVLAEQLDEALAERLDEALAERLEDVDGVSDTEGVVDGVVDAVDVGETDVDGVDDGVGVGVGSQFASTRQTGAT